MALDQAPAVAAAAAAAAAPPSAAEKLVQRPLYVFDLPEELLYTLRLRVQPSAAVPSSQSQEEQSPESLSSPTPSSSSSSSNATEFKHTTKQDETSTTQSGTSCALCNLTFANLQDQRSHVRSDLHGYNLKQRLRGQKAVTETQFEQLVANLDDSISGSDTSDSEEDSEDEDGSGVNKAKDSTLSALLKRQAHITEGDADDAPIKKRQRGGAGAGKPPMLWFTSPKLPPNTHLGVYRALFAHEQRDREEGVVETIQAKQLSAKPPPPALPKPKPQDDDEGGVPLPPSAIPKGTSVDGPHYFLCMIGGGHFAGMLVSLTPKLTKKNGIEDRSATVIAHKTFHRYTTRRKQGGSQSANDNAKGNAHSAGSSIRRYNEVALMEEIRALLSEWKTWIDTAELLFIRASGSTNRRTLFGPYDGQVLNPRDERIRGFPFSTRRATQSELMRSFIELTRVKVAVVDEAALAKQAEEAAAAAAIAASAASKPSTQTKPSTSKRSKADEEAAMHTTQLQALIKRSKAPALLSYLSNHSLSASEFRFYPSNDTSNSHAPTPLHLAAASNSPACVSALLLKAHADPTARNTEGRAPYAMASDRATREAFRLARSSLGEDAWRWDFSPSGAEGAGVPSPLSKSEVDARDKREQAEREVEEAEEKKRRTEEVERLRKEDRERDDRATEKRLGNGRVLVDKGAYTAEERRAEEARGMSGDMRAKMEREKRARAAEERMRRLQGK